MVDDVPLLILAGFPGFVMFVTGMVLALRDAGRRGPTMLAAGRMVAGRFAVLVLGAGLVLAYLGVTRGVWIVVAFVVVVMGPQVALFAFMARRMRVSPRSE